MVTGFLPGSQWILLNIEVSPRRVHLLQYNMFVIVVAVIVFSQGMSGAFTYDNKRVIYL